MNRNRTRRSAGEWAELVAAWKQSGLTAKAFAEEAGLSAKLLSWWNWKLGRGAPACERSMKLVPVTVVEPETTESTDASRWEIRLGDGVAVSMTGPSAIEGLEVALRVLERTRR